MQSIMSFSKSSTACGMVRSKRSAIGDDVVIAKIRASTVRFNLEPDGLVALKKAGVTDRVLEAMVAATSASKP